MSLIAHARAPLLIYHALAGDLLMATPMLRALGAHYGFDRPLICGTEPEHQAVLRAVGFTQLHPTRFEVRDLLPGETFRASCDWGFDVQAMLPVCEGCDLLINASEAPGPAYSELARRSGLPSVGFHADADRPICFDRPDAHTFDRYFALAQSLCGEAAVLGNHAWFSHRDDAAEIRQRVREASGPGRLLALHADTKPDKMWPLAHWAAWLQRLWQHEPETQVLLLGYPEIPIEQYALDARLHDCRDLPLTVNYELAAMVDLFVGIDSCLVHAADLCRVPSVGLFSHYCPAALFGLRFADGEMLTGANPPADVSVEAMWAAYCRVRDRQWPRRPQ